MERIGKKENDKGDCSEKEQSPTVRLVWKKIASDLSTISKKSCTKGLEWNWMKGERRGPSRQEEVVGEEKEYVQRVCPKQQRQMCAKYVLKTNFWEKEPSRCTFHVTPTFLSQVLGSLTEGSAGRGRGLRFKVWSEKILTNENELWFYLNCVWRKTTLWLYQKSQTFPCISKS